MAKNKKAYPANSEQILPAMPRRGPTEAEMAAIGLARKRLDELPDRCEMELTIAEGVRTVRAPHSDSAGYSAQLMTAFGSRSVPFIDGAVAKLMKSSGERGKNASQNEANAALAFVSAVEPANEVEAAMALQMHATNELAIDLLSRALNSDDRMATSEYTNLATKLTRTFTAQVEALAKLRRNGEQVVRHVHVYEGGQAVVAGTINNGGANARRIEQAHGQAANAPFGALPGPDASADALSAASDAERAVPFARR